MRILGVPILVMAALAAVPVSAQSFVGQWSVTAKPPQGPEAHELVTATKTADGYAVTAKLVGDVAPGTPEAGPGYEVALDGDRFTYKRNVAFNGDTVVIVYSGTVSGDNFAGTINLGGFQLPFEGVRVEPLPAPAQ
jgi:hypothetical protein